jgi:hypothetical protein
MYNYKFNDVCKKCGLYFEDHVGMWKVTNCKFEKKDDVMDAVNLGESEQ